MGGALADPLSRSSSIDFFRDVPSRNLKGLATRSDGRLVAGPTLTDISGAAPAELLWCLEPTQDPARFLLGTGPDGKVFEVTLNAARTHATTREIAQLDAPQVFALKRLPDGSILAGTSPRGGLYLIRHDKVVAAVRLPADSIFDLLAVDAHTVLAATGNPGRIYRIDVRQFATGGIATDQPADERTLASRGISLFGRIRDRNVRRLAAMPNGDIVAGSAPEGNIYTFPRDGGAPVFLQENHQAEVTDLLPQPNGDLYATVVFSTTSGEARITPANGHASGTGASHASPAETAESTPKSFTGHSSLVWFPHDGYAQTLTARSGAAFYRLGRVGDTLVIAGGDTGELLGFDLRSRFALTFAGSESAQLNGLAPIPGAPGRFLVLRNNAPGLALLDFDAAGPREAKTHRIDLGIPSRLGALRFNRLRNVRAQDVHVDVRVSNGSDEVEGWGPWTKLTLDPDGGWRADNLRGRYVRIRLNIAGAAPATDGREPPAATAPRIQLDRASLYYLPQDRPPELEDFRVLTPGFGLVVAVDQPPSPVVTLGQLLQPTSSDDKRKGAFNSSQVVPDPGAQVVLWTVVDPDGDNLESTFSIRRSAHDPWIDVAKDTRDSYAQFDTSHLPDGIYFTRLVTTETAPRPKPDRLSQTFETDDLVVDHTPPAILQATARREGDSVVVTVHGRDQLSLLDSIDVTFNNGVHETVSQPVDGILDGREETFRLEEPLARVSNANSVEVTLYDAAGNGTTRRLSW